MENRDEGIGEQLLSRLPRPANLAAYQEEVKSLLAENEEKLRKNKWTVRRVWIFVIALSIPFLALAGENYGTPQGNWFMDWVLFWVLFGAIEIAKYDHNQARVELLKELKQIQLQVVELHDFLSRSGSPTSGKP